MNARLKTAMTSLCLALAVTAAGAHAEAFRDTGNRTLAIPDKVKQTVAKPWTDFAIDEFQVSRDGDGFIQVQASVINKGSLTPREPLRICYQLPGEQAVCTATGQRIGLGRGNPRDSITISAQLDGSALARDTNNGNNNCEITLRPLQATANKLCNR